jgi:hypothetical protein
MVIGAKFWHGNMKARLIFPMSNFFTQIRGREQGICTAASLAWCRACLKLSRGVNSFAEIGLTPHILNIQMATLRRYDSRPEEQTEMAQLNTVGPDRRVNLDQMLEVFKTTFPHIGIFWTHCHTMGYRYAHHEKEFFDIEEGLFRSKYTEGIKAKIEENYRGQVIGCRVVRL